jgi:DNA polymerase-3 subunit delta'
MWDERKVMAGLHVDVSVLDNGPGSLIKVDDIRAIRRDSLLRPFDGEVKVYIIAHAQNMNASAQNALLRILEEPPPYVRFVLNAANAEALLPTVRSRCVVRRLLPDGQGENERSERAESFVSALDDPWQRMSVAYSWDKLPRDALKGVLNAVLACLRDRCLQDGLKPVYTETLETVLKLLPALELNASVGSVCGVLAVAKEN